MSSPASPSIAFYYGAQPPLTDLAAFDIAVVDPDHVPDPAAHRRAPADGAHELYAYVSLGEIQPSRRYYADLPPGVLHGGNAAWGSRVIDQAAPGWRGFFLDRVIEPLWQAGWRGFFLDTLDSYQLFAATDAERAAQAAAMTETIRELKRRHPEARLILNRGFELLPQIAPLVQAVAAESLYEGYDAARKAYRPVPRSDRDWLLAQLDKVRDTYKLPAIVIDYVSPDVPGARERARETAQKILAHGFVPWVADGDLASVGVGSIETVPREVLVLVNNPSGVNLDLTGAQRFVGMPLNYLGMRYEIVNTALQPLPDGILAGRYAGVVTWFSVGAVIPGLKPWLQRQLRQGVRLAVFNDFGLGAELPSLGELGLQSSPASRPARLTVSRHDAGFIGFEAEAIPDRDLLKPIRINEGHGRSLLQLTDERGNRYDAAALTDWGGFVLSPFALRVLETADQERWIVQPLAFLKAALRLPDVPVPDVTTEAGRRILLSHVDGDGFASRAELPGSPFSGDVLLREVLERYRLPIALSVIEGEVSAAGLYPQLSPLLEPIARRIFALPFVEAASHTYSHPFYWSALEASTRKTGKPPAAETGKAYNLSIPGYAFSDAREIKGSMDYVERLLPPGKHAALLLWPGDCAPPAGAVRETYRDGYLNMNGGDTLITNSRNTWTAIAAQGVRKDGWYQVYAPNQNENIYTGDWTGPFYGYQRAIETFALTGAPHRFKPIDIYYHFYSATKQASLAALRKAYDWAVAQPLSPLFPSQYIRKVLDFESTTLARDLKTGDLLVRTGADLRTLRLPEGAAMPSLARSDGIAGVSPGPAGDY
ncbi:MAG: bifunctional glycoside hydrolase 114/ polysaccharide deacetylase family protein, partial [Burkholderiaceae bacterium]